MRGKVDAQHAGGAGAIFEGSFRLRPGGQRQRPRPRRYPARRPRRSEIERQGHGVLPGAVIADGHVDFPEFRVRPAAPHTDFTQPHVLHIVGNRNHAQIARQGRGRGIARRGPSRADECDLARAMAILRLNMAREQQGPIEIERRGAGLGSGDGLFDFLTVHFEGGGRRGHSVGAHQHHTVTHGQGLEILTGPVTRHVHQGAIAGAPRHPRRSIQHDHMIAPHLRGRAQAQLADGQ